MTVKCVEKSEAYLGHHLQPTENKATRQLFRHFSRACTTLRPTICTQHKLASASTSLHIARELFSVMATDSQVSDYVTLISSDDFSFVVQRSAACLSPAIRRMLDPSSTCSTIIQSVQYSSRKPN